jgi:hypothetical protein
LSVPKKALLTIPEMVRPKPKRCRLDLEAATKFNNPGLGLYPTTHPFSSTPHSMIKCSISELGELKRR